MKKIEVETLDGIIEETVYDVKDVPLEALESIFYLNKSKGVEYSNAIMTFDIETSTIIPEKYVKNKDGEPPYGFMYHWQSCLNGVVVFGRYWHEFRYLLWKIESYYRLNEKRRIVIYVHFLSFEFQFFCQMIHIDEVFATKKRQVLVVRSNGFEFRCSYRLSNKSLAKFCEDTPGCRHVKLSEKTLQKLVKENPVYKDYKLDKSGYDYKKIRTPRTEMSMRELAYCYNDVMGLYECIKNLLEEDTIASIPLTSTGYVRREVRRVCQGNNYRRLFRETAINEHQYELLRDMFRGGNTHANAMFTGRIVENVYSFDKVSSYIEAINNGYYPMGKLTLVKIVDGKDFYKYKKKYCCMMRVGFINIRLKEYNPCPYIDLAHCKQYRNVTTDNGRVVDADFLYIAMTEIDFDIIDKMYEFDTFFVDELYVSRRRKLPVEIRVKMMEYFLKKTTLKDVDEYLYIKSKNKLNAFYGMMVTAIAHVIYSYLVKTCEWVDEEEDVVEELGKFFESRSNFLAYQWGVYVTAHARNNLQMGLDIVKNDLVYTDTDSVKFINDKHIEKFNELNSIIRMQCIKNDVQSYVDYNGRHYLGIWEYEGRYDRFKTYGAKKYAYEMNGDFKITVSGMSKEKGSKVIGCLENFNIGETYHDIGRTVSFYNDCKKHYVVVNGDKFLNGSNVGVVDTTYKLGVTSEYWEYFNDIQIEGVSKFDD